MLCCHTDLVSAARPWYTWLSVRASGRPHMASRAETERVCISRSRRKAQAERFNFSGVLWGVYLRVP